MIELLIQVIAALLNGVSRYRAIVYKSTGGASWNALFRFENDPNDDRFGGGLALVGAHLKFDPEAIWTKDLSPVSFVQFTTSRTTYFTRVAQDNVVAGSSPLLDGMGVPDSSGGGVRLLPRPWNVAEASNPKAFSMSAEEQLAIVASMKAEPSARPVAKDVIAIHFMIPPNTATSFPIGAVQFDVRARFQAANYQFISGFRFLDNGVIEPYVTATGATLPGDNTQESRAKVHLHDFYTWFLLDTDSMVGPTMDAQKVLLKHSLTLPYFVFSGHELQAPDSTTWPALQEDENGAHLKGLRILNSIIANSKTLDDNGLPGTWKWLEGESDSVVIEWQHDDFSDAEGYLTGYKQFTDQGWRALLRNVSFTGDAGHFIAKLANLTRANYVDGSNFTATNAKGLKSGPAVLGCLRLYHLHLPSRPDANLTALRSVAFAIRPRFWQKTSLFDKVFEQVKKQ